MQSSAQLENMASSAAFQRRDSTVWYLRRVSDDSKDDSFVANATKIRWARRTVPALKGRIGIGRSLAAPPSHTTLHTGPYRAVR